MTDAYLDELKRARAEMAKLIEKYSGLEVADLLEAFATEALTEDAPMSSLETLEALAKAATPGEWELHTPTVIGLEVPEFARAEDWIIAETFGHGDDHDAAYIAAANPQAILSLLAEHRQLIERVEVLEGARNKLHADMRDAVSSFGDCAESLSDRIRHLLESAEGDARKALGADS